MLLTAYESQIISTDQIHTIGTALFRVATQTVPIGTTLIPTNKDWNISLGQKLMPIGFTENRSKFKF
jgi:hypothetical protein